MNRLLHLVAIWMAGLASCGTQQPRLATPTDPGLQSPNLSSQTGITTRRVWTGPGVDFLGSPSPDGKLLSFAEWSTGNLGVRDLLTGQNRRLTHKRAWSESNSYAENSAIAPNGRWIAYTWLNDSTNQYELRVIEVNGARPRVLVATKEIGYFAPPAWSPSGREIAVGMVRADGTSQLTLVSAETGTFKVLKSFDWRDVWKVSFSPDGRFLAYDFPPDDTSRANEIYVIATDGSRETRVANHRAHDQVVGWTPDGNHLLFFSEREGTEGLWAVPIADGRGAGEPILVRRDLWRADPIGLSQNGLYYGVTTENRSLFVATVDLERARTISPPAAEPMRLVPWPNADWSPDGGSIAFGVAGPRSSRIGIRTLENQEVREIPTSLDRAPNRIRWSPDGNSLVAAVSQRGRYGIFRVDLRTGQAERLVAGDGFTVRSPEFSPDGQTLYFGRSSDDGRPSSIVARHLESGTERIVCQCRFMWHALSPDGRWIAFAASVKPASGALVHTIQVVPVAGGEPRVIYRSPPTYGLSGAGLAWSRDGRYLLFVRESTKPPGAEKQELMVMPAEGGEPRPLFAAPGIRGVRMHPDGRRILFTGGEFKGEVWVMENLPAALLGHSSAK